MTTTFSRSRNSCCVTTTATATPPSYLQQQGLRRHRRRAGGFFFIGSKNENKHTRISSRVVRSAASSANRDQQQPSSSSNDDDEKTTMKKADAPWMHDSAMWPETLEEAAKEVEVLADEMHHHKAHKNLDSKFYEMVAKDVARRWPDSEAEARRFDDKPMYNSTWVAAEEAAIAADAAGHHAEVQARRAARMGCPEVAARTFAAANEAYATARAAAKEFATEKEAQAAEFAAHKAIAAATEADLVVSEMPLDETETELELEPSERHRVQTAYDWPSPLDSWDEPEGDMRNFWRLT